MKERNHKTTNVFYILLISALLTSVGQIFAQSNNQQKLSISKTTVNNSSTPNNLTDSISYLLNKKNVCEIQKYQYIKKEKKVPPVMEKVFPDLIFVSFYYPINSDWKHGYAYSKDTTYFNLRYYFNKAFREMNHKKRIDLHDKFEAAIYLLTGYDQKLSNLSIHEVNPNSNNGYNYTVNCRVNYTNETFFFKYKTILIKVLRESNMDLFITASEKILHDEP